jgi:hypothetical protein
VNGGRLCLQSAEDFHFARFDGETILIWDEENALVGGFIETDLSLDEDFNSPSPVSSGCLFYESGSPHHDRQSKDVLPTRP